MGQSHSQHSSETDLLVQRLTMLSMESAGPPPSQETFNI